MENFEVPKDVPRKYYIPSFYHISKRIQSMRIEPLNRIDSCLYEHIKRIEQSNRFDWIHFELSYKLVEAAVSNEPVKYVRSQADMMSWQRSQAYHDLIGFINGISEAIQGIRIGDDIHVSETMQNLLNIFDKLNKIIDETPPVDQAEQRFGNKAFRTWQRKMNHDIFILVQQALPQEKCEYFTELGCFLSESFGNAVRIDYGTGHELFFLFFLCALFRAEILVEEDNVACALRLFNTYLLFVRRLQMTYRLEPAGSQGVWALDDYQFVPFIWGSAQLALNSPFDPSKFLDEPIINEFKHDYMFIGCIDYISKVKTGHFAEHSNQLWSISAVPSWAKINSGLVKMYQKEILSKFPIIQHMYFGKLMVFSAVKPGTPLPQAQLGYVPPKPAVRLTTARESRFPAVSKESSTGTMMPPPTPPSSNSEVENIEVLKSDDNVSVGSASSKKEVQSEAK